MGNGEVGRDDGSTEVRLTGQLEAQIESPGAGIQEPSVRVILPTEEFYGLPPPTSIDVEAEDMIQEIVAWCDLGEESPDLVCSARAQRWPGFGDCRHLIDVFVSFFDPTEQNRRVGTSGQPRTRETSEVSQP